MLKLLWNKSVLQLFTTLSYDEQYCEFNMNPLSQFTWHRHDCDLCTALF